VSGGVMFTLAAALLAQAAPCPVTLPNGTAVRGGFAPSPRLPDFTIRNREDSHVLVKLEDAESGEDHVYFIAAEEEVTISGVPLGSYVVSVAVAGRFAPDCRTLASADALYRFEEPFVFTRVVTENPDGSRDTRMDGHWIELGNDSRTDAGSAAITVGAFNG
jgi:hypothetical protein